MLVAAAASRAPPPRAAWSRRSTGCTTQTYFFVFVVLMGTSFVLFLQQYHAASNFIEQIQNEADTAVPRRPSQRGIQAADPHQTQTQRVATSAVSSSSSSSIELLRHLKMDTAAAAGSRNTSAMSPFTAWANTQQEKAEKEPSQPQHDHNKKKQESEQQQPSQDQPHPQRLNVVLFYADDWTMKVLGALDPHHIVQTPHLDAMASRGMLFTNNCVTTSVCWMSRSTLSTGTYGAIHQHHMPFQEAVFETQHWNDTLYPKMKQAHRTTTKTKTNTNQDDTEGYYTGLFGKWHKLELQDELQQAFHEHKIYYGNHWETRNGQSRHVTDLNQDDALDFLQRWNQRRHEQPHKRQQKTHEQKSVYQPFFLTMSFFATHAEDGKIPSYRPKNETRLGTYPDWPLSPQVPVPKTATELHYQQLPRFLIGEGNNEGRMRWRNRFEPHNFQNSIKDMYSMATEVDTAVGAVMQQIKQMDDDVYNNTVFIFTTDNGNMHGEHGLAEKWYPFEESIRVPLVIQDPRMPEHRKGTRNDAWTLNVDLPTTILGVANIPPAPFMQGRNIADLYLDEDEDARVVSSAAAVAAKKHHPILSNDELRAKVQWREAWFYEFNLGTNLDGSAHPWKNFIDASFALVTDEWKYVVWPQQDHYEQLFHRSVDPYDEWDLIARILEQKRNQQQNTKHTSTANTTTRMTTTKDSPFVSRRRQLESIVSEGAHNNNNNNNNNGNSNIQTTLQVYEDMKQRYHKLKAIAQSGAKI